VAKLEKFIIATCDKDGRVQGYLGHFFNVKAPLPITDSFKGEISIYHDYERASGYVDIMKQYNPLFHFKILKIKTRTRVQIRIID
jgi:hypothetical protein